MTDAYAQSVDKEAMIAWVARGGRPAAEWKIGTEHEKFLFRCNTREPITYDVTMVSRNC